MEEDGRSQKQWFCQVYNRIPLPRFFTHIAMKEHWDQQFRRSGYSDFVRFSQDQTGR
jgi:hypothetical protein